MLYHLGLLILLHLPLPLHLRILLPLPVRLIIIRRLVFPMQRILRYDYARGDFFGEGFIFSFAVDD